MALYYFGRPAHRYLHQELEKEDGNNSWNCEGQIYFPVDIKVNTTSYEITAHLPGIKAKDLDIEVVDRLVTISGEMEKKVSEEDNYLLQERPVGHFSRTIQLPDPVNFSKAEAKLKDGVLTLVLPKQEEILPKTIKVTAK